VATQGWHDPSLLVREAMALFGDQDVAPQPHEAAAETAIRRAHELISPNLYVIEQLKQAGMEPDYAGLFRQQHDEKVAALVFLTKHKLLDIEQCAAQSRDTDDARRDLSTYVEVLFRLQAVDALKIFYDFAAAQRDSRVPWLWRNVIARCLYLMAIMAEARQQVIAFLEERSDARRMIDALLQTTAKEVSDILHALIQDYNTTLQSPHHAVPSSSPEPYVAMAEQYEREAPAGAMAGFSSLLTAQDRIQQAASQGDVSSLVNWISQGSPAAMQAAFRQAMSVLSVPQYVALLETILAQPDLDPRRMTLAVLELGAVNRGSNAPGGLPAVNKVLADIALRVNQDIDAVGRLAVQELATVKAMQELQRVLGSAPDLAVAEELINLLADMRRLPLAETVVENRPLLEPALRAARRRFVELQELVDSACACSSEELAAIYLAQLKERRAVTELEQIGQLENHASRIAREYVTELRPDLPLTRRQY
jgi:hypothetical protein